MWNMAKNTSLSGRWIGRSVIYGKDGEHATPYATRYCIGRLRFHIFHRPDQDPDCHDHPWGFWTFPLTSYVEEVIESYDSVVSYNIAQPDERPLIATRMERRYTTRLDIVKAFRIHYRPATHTHRVLGAYAPEKRYDPSERIPFVNDRKPIYTIVWRERESRGWGFLKERFGKWCWVPSKKYIFEDGKSAPCE